MPAEHLDEFDDRLAEARLMNRLRDERGVYSDGWAIGLARRALLEAGRRLADANRLHAADHAVDLTSDELAALLRRAGADRTPTRSRPGWTGAARTRSPTHRRSCVRCRRRRRRSTSSRPAPAAWPARSTRCWPICSASRTRRTPTPSCTASPVNDGVYEGPARIVDNADDFGRIKQGDVLVTRMTSPYFNVVLPLLGAIVTDRGGQLCHAAIVAREYGIPGIVGTREATAKIRDGARVRVDGTTGEVRLLG